jgi:hypothetical protein
MAASWGPHRTLHSRAAFCPTAKVNTIKRAAARNT